MQRLTSGFTSPNKYLQDRWQQEHYKKHREKIETARPVVDTRAPSDYFHIHVKLKHLKLEEQRYKTIEKENHRLLNKMASIMKNGAVVDCHNEYAPKSLNEMKRKQQKETIWKENQRLMLRILRHTACGDSIQRQKLARSILQEISEGKQKRSSSVDEITKKEKEDSQNQVKEIVKDSL